MSDHRTSTSPAGSRTGGGGTPVAVDLSGDRQARSIFVVLLGGPVVWFTHFMVVYLVVEAGCTGSGDGLAVFDPPVSDVVTLAATAVAAAVCLGLAVWGLRRWRASMAGRPVAGGERDGALALAGTLLSVLSFVTVLLVGLPALVLSAC